ncbi:MAG: hypothetical protein H7844_14770 [Nitrospirae bacterium YQR-1]
MTNKTAIIYWDVSIPVKGYVAHEPEKSNLVKFLKRNYLLFNLSKNNIKETYVSKVGKGVSDPKKAGNLDSMLDLKEYKDVETRLADIFKHDNFTMHNTRIIVTDGVQSSTKDYSGSDVFGVVNSARDAIIKNKLHFWIIAIKTDYLHPDEKGKRYSELNRKWLEIQKAKQSDNSTESNKNDSAKAKKNNHKITNPLHGLKASISREKGVGTGYSAQNSRNYF